MRLAPSWSEVWVVLEIFFTSFFTLEVIVKMSLVRA